MGLLDDAIREHLELKRRRGADAEEVTRLEQEALGPPQRGEFAATAASADAREAPPPPAPALEEDPVVAVQAEPLPEVVEPPVQEPDPPPEEPEPRGDVEAGWLDDEEPAPAGEPVPERLDQPTAEYAPPAETSPEGEDVLEETPDFLQETPEHERLWFEQKPPRDFDLDR